MDSKISRSGLPIIDFSNWEEGSVQERFKIGTTLTTAFHEVGFVYIINHGMEPNDIAKAFEWSKRLFDLELEEKMLAPHPPGPTVHRGYSYPGLEKVSQVISSDVELGRKLREVRDCKESYEIGSEANEEQPNIWLPEDVLPGYKDFMMKFYWKCSEISHKILMAIGMGLKLGDPEFFLKFHSGCNNQLRLLHYPPIAAAEIKNGTRARMPAHSDWGSITMLFQDDCGGLEIERPDGPGEFIKATPYENTMVVNVGDLLMRWSNDYLKSTLHRVAISDQDNQFTGIEHLARARYSIPYFVAPDSTTLVECLPECTNESTPVKYEPVTQRDYNLLRGKLQY